MNTKQLSVFDFIDGTEQPMKKEDVLETPVKEPKREKTMDVTETKTMNFSLPRVTHIGKMLKDEGYTQESIAEHVATNYNIKYAHKVRDTKEINLLMDKIKQEVQEFLKENFDLKLSIPIKLNARLSSALGLFRYRKHPAIGRQAVSIEISKRFLESTLTYEEIRGVILHEAVHYALFVRGEDHEDGDEHFERTLRKYNLPSSYTMKTYINSKHHLYMCDCELGRNIYFRSRKLPRTKIYSCRGCQSTLLEDRKAIIEGCIIPNE